MLSRISFVARTLVVAAAGFALLLVGLEQASAVGQAVSAGETGAAAQAQDEGPGIQATERISIPYGFDPALPLPSAGEPITASGQGACTAGQDITIAFTVTQSSTGAMATGVWNGSCTGELQTWTEEGPLATPSPNFSGGLAEACAVAETRDGETVTDDQEWCDFVILTNEPLEQAFLPVVLKE